MESITGFIYYLQNPETSEIFYVGATETSLKNRLRTHYQHLREYERGLRKANKRYEYLINLKPFKATIHLLELVLDANKLDERESFYIKHFRTINPNLTNMTDGGKGQDTSKYYTKEQKELYYEKISVANKGKAKPEGFAENLSITRQGLDNPNAKELSTWIIAIKDDNTIIIFKYGFQINSYLGINRAYTNVIKAIKKPHQTAYNVKWDYFDSSKDYIQDIVHYTDES